MMTLPIYQVDAFAEQLFSGNPAAVVCLNEWPGDKLLQQISSENNLAETAFIVPKNQGYEIRWFTPTLEVDLCGHATLAAAYIILHYLKKGDKQVNFYSPRSGNLEVIRDGSLLALDFPADEYAESRLPDTILAAIGMKPLECYRGKTDYLLIYAKQEDIEALQPDYGLLAKADGRGLIVSAPGKDCDFVSRFFAPQSGINEDPVTGSAHTTLSPYWSKRLRKKHLSAKQLSARGGILACTDEGKRVKIAGKAKLYLKGEIFV